jgi:cell division ATPase FtsA
MLKDCVAILSIGSSNINIIIGEKCVNGTFILKVNESREYYPFLNGEFCDIKELESIISTMLIDITKSNDISEITKVYVGIPGEFCKTITKNYKITFNSLKKITYKDVLLLYDLAFEDVDLEYSLAHRSKVYYLVDNVKTFNPIGVKLESVKSCPKT